MKIKAFASGNFKEEFNKFADKKEFEMLKTRRVKTLEYEDGKNNTLRLEVYIILVYYQESKKRKRDK